LRALVFIPHGLRPDNATALTSVRWLFCHLKLLPGAPGVWLDFRAAEEPLSQRSFEPLGMACFLNSLDCMPLHHIIVGYDGSSPSRRALDLAAELASAFHSSLTVMHVLHVPVTPPEAALAGWGELLDAEQHQAEVLVEEAVGSLAKRGVKAGTRLVLGIPAEQLAEAAAEADVDLLVTGTTGKRALARVFLGSVTTRLLHICSKPVLVVP
jgi:nucleotide-binding universal stress UspA family protein